MPQSVYQKETSGAEIKSNINKKHSILIIF